MQIALQWKPITVKRFRSPAISSLLSVAASIQLARVIWDYPVSRVPGLALVAVLLAIAYLQLWRIHVIYNLAYHKASDDDALLKKTLNEMVRTYLWGNVTYFLIAAGVFQFWLHHR